jgi:hypothetical protein
MSLCAGIPLSGNSMIAAGNRPSSESQAEFSPGRGSPHHPVFRGEAAGGASRRRLSFLSFALLAPKTQSGVSAKRAIPQPEYRWNVFR